LAGAHAFVISAASAAAASSASSGPTAGAYTDIVLIKHVAAEVPQPIAEPPPAVQMAGSAEKNSSPAPRSRSGSGSGTPLRPATASSADIAVDVTAEKSAPPAVERSAPKRDPLLVSPLKPPKPTRRARDAPSPSRAPAEEADDVGIGAAPHTEGDISADPVPFVVPFTDRLEQLGSIQSDGGIAIQIVPKSTTDGSGPETGSEVVTAAPLSGHVAVDVGGVVSSAASPCPPAEVAVDVTAVASDNKSDKKKSKFGSWSLSRAFNLFRGKSNFSNPSSSAGAAPVQTSSAAVTAASPASPPRPPQPGSSPFARTKTHEAAANEFDIDVIAFSGTAVGVGTDRAIAIMLQDAAAQDPGTASKDVTICVPAESTTVAEITDGPKTSEISSDAAEEHAKNILSQPWSAPTDNVPVAEVPASGQGGVGTPHSSPEKAEVARTAPSSPTPDLTPGLILEIAPASKALAAPAAAAPSLKQPMASPRGAASPIPSSRVLSPKSPSRSVLRPADVPKQGARRGIESRAPSTGFASAARRADPVSGAIASAIATPAAPGAATVGASSRRSVSPRPGAAPIPSRSDKRKGTGNKQVAVTQKAGPTVLRGGGAQRK
jgi:hypothetical protein